MVNKDDDKKRLLESTISINDDDGATKTPTILEHPDKDDGCVAGVLRFLGLKAKKKAEKDPNKEKIFAERFRELSSLDKDTMLGRINAPASGLSEQEAKNRLLKYGRNVISEVKPVSWYKLLFTAFTHPFNIVLTIIAAVSIATGDYATFAVVMFMVFMSAILRFYEEHKSSKAFTHLKSLIKTTVTVLRIKEGSSVAEELKIDMEEIVPGDIIPLKAGDVFPGDVRILESNSLFVSQSSLTGEFLPVEKQADPTDEHTSIFDTPNICLMSTNIVSGSGIGVVFDTGSRTYISSISEILTSTQTTNAFDVGVKKVAYLLMGFGVVLVPIVIVINGLTTGQWINSAMFGLSVAVGLTPEMLPMILNANLAKGASDMSKKKTIVKQLHSIQNMGAMDILCSDKTGTLTEDEVQLHSHTGADKESSEDVITYSFLNSKNQKGLKNVLDISIIETYKEKFEHSPSGENAMTYSLVEEFPFDFTRRRVSVILEQPGNNQLLLTCKGAVEEVLSCCSHLSLGQNGQVVELSNDLKHQMIHITNELNSDGLRVLSVATKTITKVDGYEWDVKNDEQGLTFHGFLAFIDPPKGDCAAAIHELRENSIQVKVLTGDNLAVAKKICKDVGIDVSRVISGPELEEVDDEDFDQIVEECTLFAKLTPIQKYNVVKALKRHGHTVGFLGDGVNDALALREADIGISVDTATNIAKDASDIILLEKSLGVINTAVLTGRTTHANTIKYIKMAASSNFGNVFSMLIASAWLPFIPLEPLQMLTQNLLYDFSQVAIPWDNVDEEFLKIPHPWSIKSLFKFMVFLGPISSIFDVTIFSYMWWYLGWDAEHYRHDPSIASIFQTGWYVEGLITQVFIVHMIRTIKVPFIQRWGSWQLVVNTLWVAALCVAIPYSPLGPLLKMTGLPLMYYPGLAITFFGYFFLTQLVKKIYIKVFGEWL
ncbi:transmembrane protein [Tieghemostelium lacteum]|uniref:Magnesium-transporting ATPase, P-type 1 n=1 Tax=Tieghemostelium lacteum TaxID=361077 RepID=A0A152A1F5_TIELA|nr:transmembrane protein [Tieghemostelium lacteum]|eukprot:KYR00056.1 transmembrane protein [Tieghemostelium lacteum]